MPSIDPRRKIIMSRFGYDDGFKKVGHKARTGSGRSTTGVHRQHHVSLPSAYERDRNKERRKTLNDLRAADLDAETYSDYDFADYND